MFTAGPPSSTPFMAAAGVAAASSQSSTFQLQVSNNGNGNLHCIGATHDAAAANSGAGNGAVKRKRRPAGTPDPDAEVVSLSPRTLMESDRYVCEICNQGFQRDQNLQMHRRRHKVPWKLLKREDAAASGSGTGGPSSASAPARKRVFVCPESSCLHHDPLHALGDLVGIKKHYRRKHSQHRQWSCARCGKAYAVHSDYKAHLKTCGTRGHSCDCGRVFSRVESFIEHQDACHAGRARGPELQHPPPQVMLPLQQHAVSAAAAAAAVPACLSRTASSPSPSSDTNFSPGAAASTGWPSLHRIPPPLSVPPLSHAGIALGFLQRHDGSVRSPQTPMMLDSCNVSSQHHRLELQLLPRPAPGTAASSSPLATTPSPRSEEGGGDGANERDTQLLLTIGTGDHHHQAARSAEVATDSGAGPASSEAATRIKDDAREQLRAAEQEKAAADQVRAQARHQIEMAERELANARRFRQQAQQDLARAQLIRDHAVRQINATLLQITCQSCKHHFMASAAAAAAGEVDVGDVNSLGLAAAGGACSYASASVVTEGEGDVDDVHHRSARVHHAAAATAVRFAKT